MKNDVLKGSLALLCFLLISPWVKGQEAWELIEEKDGVKIYSFYTSCNDLPHILLKVENTNAQKASVSWNSQFNLMEQFIETDDNKSVDISAGASLIGSCEDATLSIDPSKFVSIYDPEVCSYMISNLTIK